MDTGYRSSSNKNSSNSKLSRGDSGKGVQSKVGQQSRSRGCLASRGTVVRFVGLISGPERTAIISESVYTGQKVERRSKKLRRICCIYDSRIVLYIVGYIRRRRPYTIRSRASIVAAEPDSGRERASTNLREYYGRQQRLCYILEKEQ